MACRCGCRVGSRAARRCRELVAELDLPAGGDHRGANLWAGARESRLGSVGAAAGLAEVGADLGAAGACLDGDEEEAVDLVVGVTNGDRAVGGLGLLTRKPKS